MSVQQIQHLLVPEPQSPSVARALLRASLAEWGLCAWQDDASVVLSELATNAVIHANTLLMMCVCCDDQWLEVSVADDSPWPVVQRPHRDDVAADLAMLIQAEQHLVQHLDERDVRLDVGTAGTLTGGRGLLLVEALADDWGVTPRARGKVVWARFALGT